MKKTESQELELAPQQQVGRPELAKLSPLDQVTAMIDSVLKKGTSKEDVAVVEALMGVFERMQTKSAEQAFNTAFVELQSTMPKVKATEPVPNNDGSVRYRFAPYEAIMDQVGPLLVTHGFTVSFSNRYDGNRIIAICTLRHRAGHSAANEFAVRIGSGPPKASEAQADGAAATYAKRFALCNALNIRIEKLDNDAQLVGATISKAQADLLRQRVRATGSDEKSFLKYAGADSFENIGEAVLPMLEQMLRRKESTK